MNWLAWRQHRIQFLIFGILLVIYAAVVIPSGLHFWHAYQQMVSSCAHNPANPSCTDIYGNLFRTTTDKLLIGLIPTAVLFLPIILGVFWGAPLLSKEYAEGTNSLVWTQSISRRKWLTVKLAWMLLATALLAGAFAALNTWWSKTPNALNMDRFSNGNQFGIQGIVPVAISLFAVSYGIMLGAWFRKTMVAVGITLVLFVACSHIVIPNLLRPNYLKPLSVTAPFGPDRSSSGTGVPSNAWITSQIIYNGSGREIVGDIFSAAPPQCQKVIQQAEVPNSGGRAFKAVPSPNGDDPIAECLDKAGWYQVTTYQPGYRYWDFQEIESAIYLGLAAIAVGATYWLVLKRDA